MSKPGLDQLRQQHIRLLTAQEHVTQALVSRVRQLDPTLTNDPKIGDILITGATLAEITRQVQNTQARISSTLDGHQ